MDASSNRKKKQKERTAICVLLRETFNRFRLSSFIDNARRQILLYSDIDIVYLKYIAMFDLNV